MKTGLSQQTGLRQELRINPRLYQAMDMLYMPMMDLQQHLKQELLVNPFLELLEPEEEEEGKESAEKEKEKEKEKAEKEEEIDWEEILLNGFDAGGMRQQYEEQEYVEPVSVQTKDLIDHLREQLQMQELSPRLRLLSEEFLGNISDEGYLIAPLEEILDSVNLLLESHAAGAGDAPTGESDEDEAEEDAPAPAELAPGPTWIGLPEGQSSPDAPAAPAESKTAEAPVPKPRGDIPGVPYFTLAELEQMLAVIQKLDPPGIGARNLQECLTLQLREAGETDTLAYRLVSEAFNDLIAHRWNELAKRFGVEPSKVQAAGDTLSRFDPKPGLKHTNRSDGYIIPDLIVDKVDGKYHISLNDSGVPRLRLSRSYQDIARDKKKLTQENREFIANKLNSANWMIQAIEQRRQTMLKVMNFIVDRQRAFFEKGVEYLKPLTLREVAEVISMHESTVSRVTNEKYVQTPRGVLPLKFFFSSALTTASGEDASARSIRAKLQKMVQEEDPAKPLTDQQIVHLFQEQGIQIARRTVAKYRDQLGILPARMRKRV
ncbi:MAG TPA: RNA polymerase factor sigma-54 [Candidatus Polarisedimenticolia bacterium]|nr:RNA polymerase factor sigma-54 [Candidatus Polarisedimenticolia bacterium]